MSCSVILNCYLSRETQTYIGLENCVAASPSTCTDMSCILCRKNHEVTEGCQWDFLQTGPWKPVTLPASPTCGRADTLRHLACILGLRRQAGSWGRPTTAGRTGHQCRFTFGFYTFRQKPSYKEKIVISSFLTLHYCAVFELMDFGAKPPWFADQFCHLLAERPWPRERTFVSLGCITILVIQITKLNGFLTAELLRVFNVVMTTVNLQEIVSITSGLPKSISPGSTCFCQST